MRIHQCHADGCDTMARFDVRLHLPVEGAPPRELSMNCTIKTCHVHRNDVSAYVLSEINKRVIRSELLANGYPMPIFENARIEFVPIKDDTAAVDLRPMAGCDRMEGDAKCTNPAKWQIKQIFRRIGQRKDTPPIAEVLTNICVCDKHKKEAKPADFLDMASRRLMKRKLNEAGFLMPDIDNHQIGFEPLPNSRPIAPGAFTASGN